MSNVFLYAHGGSGNHGCEAIVRGTADILEGRELSLISSAPEQDRAYGIDGVCSRILLDTDGSVDRKKLSFWRAYLALHLKHDFVPMDKQLYLKAFSNIRRGDIAMSIGGDNYCYADAKKYTMFHDMLKDNGAYTVLWGCSVEPDMTRQPEIAQDLARYDLITARESISYEALSAVNPHTVQVSDPAFCLQPEKTELPAGFEPGRVVGINLSPMAIENETVPNIAMENYQQLISWILENTEMKIALIPHVVWEKGDDRIPLRQLYDKFSHTGRVIFVQDQNCRKLKYLISQCSFFVGARTHATIAAYSTGVPTLVLGYSVKARGIARDLFGNEQGYVLPVQHLQKSGDLTESFVELYNRRNEIHSYLEKIMPAYIQKARVGNLLYFG